jgi:3-hydroxyisobutyrate dehydrogenase-like beta-hydroxyacid dehydrogenase
MPDKTPFSPAHTVIALLGIGMMGAPMARRLCAAGYRVHVWNRNPAKAEALQAHGAHAFALPADSVRGAHMVITMLQDGPAVESVLFKQGTAAGLQPGTLVVDMSSIQPREARDHAARLAALSVDCLDAPVSGGTVGAEAGTLAIMAGGRLADFERARPVLQVLGRPTHVGPMGSGQLAKLANQMIVGITIGAVAEALLFAAKGGADMGKVREAISGGFAESRVLQVHGQRMVERDFAKRAAVTVQLKDMRNAMATATETGFEAPITALFAQLFEQATEHGLGELDHSALFVELASRNGMN